MSIATIDNKGGGVKLVDINPTRGGDSTRPGAGILASFAGVGGIKIPVSGYDKISVVNYSSTYKFNYLYWVYEDGTESSAINISSYSTGWTPDKWSPYYSIPDNCVMARFDSGTAAGYIYYSLLTKDSPYNV